MKGNLALPVSHRLNAPCGFSVLRKRSRAAQTRKTREQHRNHGACRRQDELGTGFLNADSPVSMQGFEASGRSGTGLTRTASCAVRIVV